MRVLVGRVVGIHAEAARLLAEERGIEPVEEVRRDQGLVGAKTVEREVGAVGGRDTARVGPAQIIGRLLRASPADASRSQAAAMDAAIPRPCATGEAIDAYRLAAPASGPTRCSGRPGNVGR